MMHVKLLLGGLSRPLHSSMFMFFLFLLLLMLLLSTLLLFLKDHQGQHNSGCSNSIE